MTPTPTTRALAVESLGRRLALAMVVLSAGAFWLGLTARYAFLSLSWSDEIVYAVMARNVAEGRGIITNFYDSRALLERGYPQGDVHMPGHSLFMSPFFRLLGHADWVAFAPGWAAFLSTGAAVWAFASRAFGGATGLLSALLFFAMPATVGYAHSSMAEMTVALASAIFLWAWWGCETPLRGATMAVALGLGVLCRETLLVFLVLAVEAVLRVPRGTRRRVTIAVLAALMACAALLWPLHMARARFPHVLSSMPSVGSIEWRRAVVARVRASLELPTSTAQPEDHLAWVLLALAIALPVTLLVTRGSKEVTRLAAASLTQAIVVLGGVVAFYPLRGWHLTRILLFLSPWLAALLGATVSERLRGAARWTVAVLVLSGFGWASVWTVRLLADDRRVEQAANAAAARHFVSLKRGAAVETAVVLYAPWEIGWRCFPITVVWNGPSDAVSFRRVDEVRQIDAVFGRNEPAFAALADAAGRGLLRRPYRLHRRRPNAEYQLLLRSDLSASRP